MTKTKELEPTETAVNNNGASRQADLMSIDDVQGLIEQTVAQINLLTGKLEVLNALHRQLRESEQWQH